MEAPTSSAKPGSFGSAAQPSGIAGWLILIAIGQIFGPLRTVVSLGLYYTDATTKAAFEKFPVALYGEALLNIAFAVVVGFTAYAFFTKKRSFPISFTVEIALSIFLVPIDYLWMSLLTGISFGQLIEDQDVSRAVIVSIPALLLLAYVWRSVRVKNTFVNYNQSIIA
jgi:hypothetical protein